MITIDLNTFNAIHAACYAGFPEADMLALDVRAEAERKGIPACRTASFADYCDVTADIDEVQAVA